MTTAVSEKGTKMDIEYKMNVHVPYKVCEKCNKIEPTKETLFSIDGEPYITRNFCKHSEICINVVELMATEERKEK